MKRRFLSLLTTLALCLTLCPAAALAEDGEIVNPAQTVTEGETPEDTETVENTLGGGITEENSETQGESGENPDVPEGDQEKPEDPETKPEQPEDTEKQPETPDDVEENPAEPVVDKKLCPHHKEHTEECGDSCEYQCTLCEAISAIQAQIDALPEPEEAIADEALTEQLNAISQSLAELSPEDAALVDISRLEALAELFSVPEETVKVYRSENDVASVTVEGGEPQYFETVRAAFKAANEAGKAVVTLLKDTEIEDETNESGEYTAITITSDVTLDAGEYTLSGKSGKAYNCSTPTVFIIRDGGTFTLQRGTIHATAGDKVISVRGGTFNMEGGLIKSDASGFVLSVLDTTADADGYQKTESFARLSGGTIDTPDKAVHIYGKGSSAVFDGCALTVRSVSLNTGATLDISGGTITSKGSDALIVATSDGANTKLNVSGGTIVVDSSSTSTGLGVRCLSVQGWNSSVQLSGGTFINTRGPAYQNDSTIICETVGNSIKLNDLLADGYSYNQNGVWLSEDEVNSLDKLVGTVIVGKMAFTFTEQPAADTAITYGVDKNLQVSVERAGDVEDEITYQWFYRPKAEEGAEAEEFKPIEGATSATVSLKEIPVGEYEFYCEVSCGEFIAASQTAAVSVSKVQPYITDLSAASIVYGDALSSSELTGTAQYSETNATAIPGTFAWKESTVQPSVADSNITEYAVVFTPDDAVNYESVEKTVKLTVNKKPLTVTGITAAGKRYDGNNRVEITAVTLNGKVGADEVSVNTTGLTGTVSGSNAGTYAAVTLPQMTLTGAAAENYTLTQPTGAVETSVTISKAAPLLPKTGDLPVVNKHTHTYTFGLGALRPDVREGMSLGSSAVTYTLGTISLGDYYSGTGAAIDGQTLTLPIQAVESEEVKEIGTVAIIIHTDNFEDMTAVIRVRSVNKILPAGGPEPSSDTLIYGQALKEITLSGTMLDTENNIEVPGTFTWSSPENRPAVQDHYSAAWTFTPDDNDTYAIVTGTVIIQVDPAPVASAVITLEPAAFRYDGTAHSPTITGVKLGETLLEEGVDYTANIPTGTEAGSYTVTITGKGNYTGTATATFEINPVKEEEITLPNDTEAKLTVESGLTSVPDGLQSTEFNTVSAIEFKLRTEVTTAMNDSNVQVAVYDVRLQYLENGVWKDVDPNNFPAGGVTAVLPYPDGTNGTNYTFTVQHMISHTHGDKQAGTVEELPYTPVSGGLQCTFTSLSPVAVGYKLKEKTPATPSTPSNPSTSGTLFTDSGSDDEEEATDPEYDFWQTVREQINKAKSGDTVKVNARGYDRMPASVMAALKKSDNVTLRIRWSGGAEIVIPSAKALSESLRIYYPLSYLAKYDFGDPVPEPTPEHLNPTTGGDIEVEAPVTAEAPLDAAGAPVVTDPRRGLAETEEQAEQGMEKAIPGVYQPEIPASEAVNPAEPVTPEPETGRSGGVLPLVLALLAAAVCGGVWVWKNKRDWFDALRKSK